MLSNGTYVVMLYGTYISFYAINNWRVDDENSVAMRTGIFKALLGNSTNPMRSFDGKDILKCHSTKTIIIII